jgi:hypothetical protein
MLRPLQRLSAWRQEVAEGRSSRALVTEPPDKFTERLTAFAEALGAFGFSMADAAVLVAGELQLLSLEPQALKRKVHMLQSLFHPYGDGPFGGKLPAALSNRHDVGTTRLHATLLCAPHVLSFTADGLREYMHNLVALGGLFGSEAEAREACMCSPRLLLGHSWGRLVRLKAAVLEGSGSLADVQWALRHRFSVEDLLDASLLKYRFGCVSLCRPCVVHAQKHTIVEQLCLVMHWLERLCHTEKHDGMPMHGGTRHVGAPVTSVCLALQVQRQVQLRHGPSVGYAQWPPPGGRQQVC